MARPESTPGGRRTVVATRLSADELVWLDQNRRSLSRAEYLRWLMVRERRALAAQKDAEASI